MAISIPLNVAGAQVKWPEIAPDELSCTASPIESEAPAEILEYKLEITDTASNDQKRTEYRRCKIYNPSKAEDLTRLNFRIRSNGNETAAVRLTLPDGTTKEFSEDDMKERDMRKNSSSTAKQKFFAVPGVVPGSIIEYRLTDSSYLGQGNSREAYYFLQKDDYPVRLYDWTCHYTSSSDFVFQYFLYSAPSAVVEHDEKNRTLHIKASKLPAVHAGTSFLGPRADYTATLYTTYDSPRANLLKPERSRTPTFQIDKKATPWASVATGFYTIEYIYTQETPRAAKLAASLCEGATSDLEKARRIHKKVQELYTQYAQKPRARPELDELLRRPRAANPDDTLDFASDNAPFISTLDFFWLAVALFRSAGLETRTVALHNHLFTRFDRQKVTPASLDQICAAVRIDGKWQFSYPLPSGSQFIYLDYYLAITSSRSARRLFLPFGMLPPSLEGEAGLVLQPNSEEFIPIPPSAADKNVVARVGTFKIDADGGLTGEAMMRLTGHKAAFLRAELVNEKPERRSEITKKHLLTFLKSAEIEITKIVGVEDPDQALEVTFKVEWPGFATFTKDTMIIKPEIFRSAVNSPFVAAKRKHSIFFGELWQEIDRITLQIPPEYKPESPESPASQPGKPLHYRIKYAYDAGKNLFGVSREFASLALELPVERYPQVKAWYENMTASDHQEVVFVKKDEAAPLSAGTPTQPSSDKP
ncbi:MAG: DUF3857 domain-containing protein [Nibricoccus sp.]